MGHFIAALRIRAIVATAELCSMIGKEPPVQRTRYQVAPKGEKAYHIVQLRTGKFRGFRFSYKKAVNYAQELSRQQRKEHTGG